MPHITLPLTHGAPIMPISVWVGSPRHTLLTQLGLPIPDLTRTVGLIDTGASVTGLDPSLIAKLDLPVTGKVTVNTPDKNPYTANQYEAFLMIYHPAHSHFDANLPVIESHIAAQGFQVLLGRDFLKNCLFIFDGKAGTFTLSF